jgi:hypothetical protein
VRNKWLERFQKFLSGFGLGSGLCALGLLFRYLFQAPPELLDLVIEFLPEYMLRDFQVELVVGR